MVWGRGSGAGDPGKRLGARELGEPGWAGSLPQRHSRRGGSGCRATCRCLSSHFGAVLLDWAAGPLGKPPTTPTTARMPTTPRPRGRGPQPPRTEGSWEGFLPGEVPGDSGRATPRPVHAGEASDLVCSRRPQPTPPPPPRKSVGVCVDAGRGSSAGQTPSGPPRGYHPCFPGPLAHTLEWGQGTHSLPPRAPPPSSTHGPRLPATGPAPGRLGVGLGSRRAAPQPLL